MKSQVTLWEAPLQNVLIYNVALLKKIRPKHWFSAHLHVKFSAVVVHERNVLLKKINPEELDIDVTDSDQEENLNSKVGFDETKFLALDKCLPNRDFLQVIIFNIDFNY